MKNTPSKKKNTQSGRAPGSPAVEVIRNAKGHFRFEHTIKNGERFLDDMGKECVVVGPGMAGMPEVQYADGSTNFAFPNMLTRLPENNQALPQGGK